MWCREEMIKFNSLTKEEKQLYLLSSSEKLVDKIAYCPGYELAIEALEKCREWVKNKSVSADELYYYLENIEENDINTYMQLDKKVENEPVWICVANALAYISYDAYQYEKQLYMPETIECVDDETVKSFMRNYKKVVFE